MKLFHSNFRDAFHLKKKLFEKNFSRSMSAKRSQSDGAASCKRGIHTPLWLLIGCIIFLTREKHIVRDSDWTYHAFFFVWKASFAPFIGENSLAYENLRHSSAFSWIFLSMYKIKPLTWHFHLFYNFTPYYHLLEKPYPKHSKRNELMIHISSTWSSFSC